MVFSVLWVILQQSTFLGLSEMRYYLSGTKNPLGMPPHLCFFSAGACSWAMLHLGYWTKVGQKFCHPLTLFVSQQKKLSKNHISSAALLKGCNVQLIRANHHRKQSSSVSLPRSVSFGLCSGQPRHTNSTCNLASTPIGGSRDMASSPQPYHHHNHNYNLHKHLHQPPVQCPLHPAKSEICTFL